MEDYIGCALPAQYRGFILQTGGGVPTESCFSDGNGSHIYVQNFFTVGDPSSPIQLLCEVRAHPVSSELGSSLIPVAIANGGDCLLLHAQNGTVHLWEHETDEVTRVCDSWDQLLEGIREDFLD